MSLIVHETVIHTDGEGYLTDPTQWNSKVAEAMAAIDGVTFTNSHWAIINYLREHYELYGITPDARTLVRSLRKALGAGGISKEAFAALFPPPPADTACRYAGLPKPVTSACV